MDKAEHYDEDDELMAKLQALADNTDNIKEKILASEVRKIKSRIGCDGGQVSANHIMLIYAWVSDALKLGDKIESLEL